MAKRVLTNLDLSNNEIQNVKLQNLGADPGTPAGNGQVLYRTDTNKVRARINGAWFDLATTADIPASGIPATIVDVKGDIIVASAADTVVRKAAGANNTFLTADSAQADGLAWRTVVDTDLPGTIMRDAEHTVALHQEIIATADLTDWPRTAALDLNNQKLTSVANGTAATDAVNLGQLNSVSSGIDWKSSVRVATTANGALATAYANGQVVDGVTLVTGNDILLKDQTTGTENGIYTVNAAGAPTRRTDADVSAEVTGGMAVWVNEGTTNADTGWVLTTNDPITLGTTALVFTQFSGLGQITAGNALTKTGNTLDVAPGTGLEISADTIRIAAAAAGAGLTGGGGAAIDVNAGVGLEVVADAVRIAAAAAGNGLVGGAGSALAVGAGTGISVAADTVAIDTTVVARKVTGALTGGAVSEVLTHNLNTRDVVVTLRNNATPWEEVEVEVEATTVNTVTIRSAAALPASYTWVVVG